MFFGISRERQAVSLAARSKELYLVGLGDRRKLCVVSWLSHLWDLEEQKDGGRYFKFIILGGMSQREDSII